MKPGIMILKKSISQNWDKNKKRTHWYASQNVSMIRATVQIDNQLWII